MGNAASAGAPGTDNTKTPAQPERPPPNPSDVKAKDAPTIDNADPPPQTAPGMDPDAVEEAKQPTLSYMSCAELMEGNAFTTEAQRRKLEAFPAGTPPTPEWVMDQMRQEWTEADGDDCTGPWEYATSPVPQEREKRLDQWGLERDNGNEGKTLADFHALPVPQKAKLEVHEVLSLRLYTGPGYSALNTSLRKLETRFAITARVISITIVKLAEACGRAPRCFRGMSLGLSETYLAYYDGFVKQLLKTGEKPKAKGLFGGIKAKAEKVKASINIHVERLAGFAGLAPIDPAPLSFTTKKSVVDAFTYGKETGITLCFVEKEYCRSESASLKIGMGADVSWASQYPTEGEVLFPPFTAMLPYALEHRDFRDMPIQQAADVLGLVGAPKQFCFIPVMFVSWNTQWDKAEFEQMEKDREEAAKEAQRQRKLAGKK
eukprot:TRINITY_DN16021_c0_g1_i1.p1 TRINITY_DN16021_c0_g1~~TRINITY_DN16021_c0_g1_i1.p1  ORF type:complete len:432 (+),score=139.21 TRINITY_DN16021_c0_g1_i1:116-1411(+)